MTPAPDYQLADAGAREQINTLLEETLFVEAGAGTGKTAALVDRYLALVLAGRGVERIVAITFTDKAAAELRDRVRLGLEQALALDHTPEQRGRIETALGALDRAQISTIHAFCQRLLRSFAVRAGIDPAFEVEDAVAAERRFEERWRAYLDGLGAEADAVATVGRLLDLGLTTRNLQELAHALWDRAELAERLRDQPLTAPEADWPDVHRLREGLLSIPSQGVAEDDNLFKALAQLREIVDDLASAAPEERDARLVALLAKPPSTSRGSQDNWGGRQRIAVVRETARLIVEELQSTLAALRAKALADALPLVVRFVLDDSKTRAREGRLVFDDLILNVRNVLQTDIEARNEVRERFDTILIDEFQDTDPLQADIAMTFAAERANAPPDAGRLFLVGDPKQSIYRFRRADMAVYARTAGQLLAAGARAIDLSLNRRSLPGVLDWVNLLFERLIGETLDHEVQPPYKPIGPYRDDVLEGAAVSWFGGAIDDGRTAAQIRVLETRQIAAYCRHVVDHGWQVAPRNETPRAARFRDIAVLLPARTILQPLERALANENIPYRVEGGSLVYATQEVRDLINCLTAIDDPTDDVAVVAALRSPAYACSDVEIARYRRGGGSFNTLWPELDARAGFVAGGLRDLRARHHLRAETSIATLIEDTIADRRLVEIGLVDSGNRNAFRRARFLVEQARTFEAAGPESLRSFIEWLERRANEAILDQEGAGLDDDEDAVRILTVHAAKGLEFPIVFLAGLGAAPPNRSDILGHDRRDGAIAVAIGAKGRNAEFHLGPVEPVQQHEKAHATAERDRLLYVAATRARDHLIVSLFHKASTSDCAAARLLLKGATDAAQPMPVVDLAAHTPGQPFAGIAVEVDPESEAAFTDRRTLLMRAAQRQRYTSATALGREQRDRPVPDGRDDLEDKDDDQGADETEPWSRGRAGTHLGRAVHAALQTLPWDADGATIDAVAHAQTVAEAIPGSASEAAALIRAALASDVAQRARTAKRALREVPFALPNADASLILEGYADLVIEAGDGSIEIVDWKTDHVPDAAVDARARRYELQAGLYVLGIEAATRRTVSRVTYVFVSAGREVTMPDPATLAKGAALRLEQEAAPA